MALHAHIFVSSFFVSQCARAVFFFFWRARARLGALLLVYYTAASRSTSGSQIRVGLWRAEAARGRDRVGLLLPPCVEGKKGGWKSETGILHLSPEVWFNNQQQPRQCSMSGKTKGKEDKDHAAKGEWWWTRVRRKEGCNLVLLPPLLWGQKGDYLVKHLWWCWDQHAGQSYCPHSPEHRAQKLDHFKISLDVWGYEKPSRTLHLM